MKISQGETVDALHRIGKNQAARQQLIDVLKRIEPLLESPDFDVREMVTGPICDALFEQGEEIARTLADGTIINARYTSKIIRDFIMVEGDAPELVWEPQTTRTLVALAVGARHVLIGGAYIGDHAILIARQMPNGLVHCFEPNGDSAALLAKNADQNGLSNLRIHQMGLWASDASLVLEGDDSHASPALASGQEDSFQAISIDRYGADENIDSLDLIVLDIEGGEIEALRGAGRYLSQPAGTAPTILFEVHRSYVDWSDGLENTHIVQLLREHGYTVFALRDYNSNVPMTGRTIEIIPVERCYLEGPAHGFNMLAVKDPDVLLNRGYRVVTDVSPKLLKHRDPKLHAPLS